MTEQLLAIARNTFVQSIRQPIYFVLLGIGILALILNLSLSAFTMDDDNRFLLDMGMATIFLDGLFIAAFVATSVLSREIHDKTVLTVVSKPVGRPLFIFGKYLGVSGAILVAATILACAFMLTKRHQVLQTASDVLDWPVIIFGLTAAFLSLGVAVWGNYFYGWVFTSSAVTMMLPTSIIAWLGVLAFSKEWKYQLLSAEHGGMISPDLDMALIIALFALFMALLVMSAVAIAASTRLGQVLTVLVCLLVFLMGLLSDHMFGRRAFEAEPLARIIEIEPGRDLDDNFADEGDWYIIRVDQALELSEGMMVDVASDPLGMSSIMRDLPGERADHAQIRNLNQTSLELVRIDDGRPLRVPRLDDYFLSGPPTVHPLWRVLWSIPPNLQFLILIDPLTQGHYIPFFYILEITIYSVLYIIAVLALAVMLFQTREVG
ncbi:MAG: hypothetical protein D8M59_16025 [Planctomycetes bacterium]|nr:hypothetical protein [Planctomycetota bacterium]NOG54044.1 hypothetical protein [Planctomycetota bacterium]